MSIHQLFDGDTTYVKPIAISTWNAITIEGTGVTQLTTEDTNIVLSSNIGSVDISLARQMSTLDITQVNATTLSVTNQTGKYNFPSYSDMNSNSRSGYPITVLNKDTPENIQLACDGNLNVNTITVKNDDKEFYYPITGGVLGAYMGISNIEAGNKYSLAFLTNQKLIMDTITTVGLNLTAIPTIIAFATKNVVVSDGVTVNDDGNITIESSKREKLFLVAFSFTISSTGGGGPITDQNINCILNSTAGVKQNEQQQIVNSTINVGSTAVVCNMQSYITTGSEIVNVLNYTLTLTGTAGLTWTVSNGSLFVCEL